MVNKFLSFETGDPPAGWGVRRTNLENLRIVSDFDIRISDLVWLDTRIYSMENA
jgi:hypothetical protein